jgi:hypothetical protein
VIRDRFTDILPAMHDVDDPRRHAGFVGEFHEPEGSGRSALRRLQDEGVSHGDGRGQHPERDHAGEKGGIPATTPNDSRIE